MSKKKQISIAAIVAAVLLVGGSVGAWAYQSHKRGEEIARWETAASDLTLATLTGGHVEQWVTGQLDRSAGVDLDPDLVEAAQVAQSALADKVGEVEAAWGAAFTFEDAPQSGVELGAQSGGSLADVVVLVEDSPFERTAAETEQMVAETAILKDLTGVAESAGADLASETDRVLLENARAAYAKAKTGLEKKLETATKLASSSKGKVAADAEKTRTELAEAVKAAEKVLAKAKDASQDDVAELDSATAKMDAAAATLDKPMSAVTKAVEAKKAADEAAAAAAEAARQAAAQREAESNYYQVPESNSGSGWYETPNSSGGGGGYTPSPSNTGNSGGGGGGGSYTPPSGGGGFDDEFTFGDVGPGDNPANCGPDGSWCFG